MMRWYSSSAAYAEPTMIAPNSPWKKPSVRPAYIGLPCRREPAVPPSTGRSTMNARAVCDAGIHASSIWMLCEPLPRIPSTPCQSSRRSNWSAEMTNIRPGSCGSSGCRRVWPMKCVEYGIPEA